MIRSMRRKVSRACTILRRCRKHRNHVLLTLVICLISTILLVQFKWSTAIDTARNKPAPYFMDFLHKLVVSASLRTSPATPAKAVTSSAENVASSSQLPSAVLRPFLPCNWSADAIPRLIREQAFLRCNATSADILLRRVSFSPSIPVLTAQNGSDTATSSSDTSLACLKRVIQSERCNVVRAQRVPRVAHYVWFGKKEMVLHQFVSVLSVVRFLQPCLVLFHGDHLPTGPYWRALLQLVPIIMHVPREQPREIFGNDINVVEHRADVARLQILIEYGGVYLDTDQYLLHPVDELMRHSVVLGIENEGYNVGNALIFSEPRAPFLKLWLSTYVTLNDTLWGEHSLFVPYKMSKAFPHLLTIVHSFFRPNYNHINSLYTNRTYNWSQLYSIHLYYRLFDYFFTTKTRMDKQFSVIGDMTRHVIWGFKDFCI